MNRSASRVPVFLVVLVFSLAGIASAGPAIGPRIDLGVPDPHGLEELPGIDEAEIALLQEVAGPGIGDLGDRLAETGIARERLQLWAPYLEISGAGDPDLRGKLRIACERKPARPFRSQLRCSLTRGRIQWEALLEQTHPAVQTTPGVIREARVGIVVSPSRSVWAGSCTGGIQGGNPWNDPLGGSSTGPPPSRCFRMRGSRTARGAVAMIGPYGLATWRREGDRLGFLLARTGETYMAWYGRESERGDGIGGSLPLGSLRCTGTIYRPGTARAVVSLGLQATDQPAYVVVGWVLGARADRPGTRFDAGTSGRLKDWRIRLALTLLSDARKASTCTRGMIRLGWGQGAKRASWKVSWNERLAWLRGECDLMMRSGCHLRLEGRSTVSRARAPILLSMIPSREGRRGRIELGLMGRSDDDLAWPGVGVQESAGRVAVRLGGYHSSGGIRVRALLLAPVRTTGRVAPEDLFWQVSLEQRGS